MRLWKAWSVAAALAMTIGTDVGLSQIPPSSISVERMSQITRVLASDEFQGRSMGGVGEEKTVAYLIQQFQAAGLDPSVVLGREAV